MLTSIQHFFHDLGILAVYIYDFFMVVFHFFFGAVRAFFSLIAGFFSTAFSAPIPGEWSPSPEVVEILEAIPLFSLLSTTLGIGVIFVLFVGIIKALQKL